MIYVSTMCKTKNDYPFFIVQNALYLCTQILTFYFRIKNSQYKLYVPIKYFEIDKYSH